MSITIALAGNPNCGKTTMFNDLTGSNQYVGNWPGVTVEKKEGRLKGHKDVVIQDLPGIYSLSPYTLEEVVARGFLVKEKPDAIINILDGTNVERNLYLTTQLLELGIPVVIAVNMIDIVRKNGDKIDLAKLGAELGCAVMETSALKGEGSMAVAEKAIAIASGRAANEQPHVFTGSVEHAIAHIEESISDKVDAQNLRWYAIKLFERDEKVAAELDLGSRLMTHLETHIKDCEKELDDDAESIITNQRYAYISKVVDRCVKKKAARHSMTASDKIDRIVTNRVLALPIFAVVMYLVYWIAMGPFGSFLTDWTNDVFAAEWLQGGAAALLEGWGVAGWLTGLIVDGIIGGVGAVLGFVPQMFILFFFLSILEDCGYMARVSMVLDPIFKKVGLSGKSVISFVIGTGCAIPGVMAARTIRNERERRVTAMLTSFMPCGAKLPVIALFAGAFFADASWVGTLMYFVGIILIFVGALLINKIAGHKVRKSFFIMELPEYKIPSLKRAFYSMCSRGKAYIVKAGTVILVCNTVVQIMQSFTWQLQLVEEGMEHTSILASIASPFAVLLIPLGFGAWQLAAAAITGFIAKENVVGTLAVCYGVTNFIDTEELALVGGGNQVATIMGLTKVAALAYLMFNLYTPPCFAAMGAMNSEIKSKKWLFGGIGLQFATGFTIAFFVYQIGTLITTGSLGNGFIPGLIVVILIAAFIAHLIVKANKSIAKEYALGNNMSNSAKSA